MSRNRTPGFGKSGISRMKDLRSETDTASSLFFGEDRRCTYRRRSARKRAEGREVSEGNHWFPSDRYPVAGHPAAERSEVVGWLMGLEPTTTGITIQDSTN